MSDRAFDLLVVGELNPDAILVGETIEPAYGQVERLVERGTLTVGSSGAIVACGAARLGMRVAYVGVVGDDAGGRFMLDELRARGIDTERCRIDPDRATGLSVVLSTGADRAILTAAGAMSSLTADDVSDDALAATAHLHVSSPHLQSGLRAGLGRLFDRAHAAGASTSLDPGWDPEGRWTELEPALAATDLLLPNAAEARALAGADDPEAALATLAERVATVVVTLGPDGAICRRGAEVARAGAPAVEATDATGAGDGLAAGFLCGLANGMELEDALRLGVACGSLSTRALGGVDAQPTLAEALEVARPRSAEEAVR
jgi:sugar/nucleoside kinase (ribokinase family)